MPSLTFTDNVCKLRFPRATPLLQFICSSGWGQHSWSMGQYERYIHGYRWTPSFWAFMEPSLHRCDCKSLRWEGRQVLLSQSFLGFSPQCFCTPSMGQDSSGMRKVLWHTLLHGCAREVLDGHFWDRKMQKYQSSYDLPWSGKRNSLLRGGIYEPGTSNENQMHMLWYHGRMKLKSRGIPYPWMRRPDLIKVRIVLNWFVGTMFSNLNPNLS